MSIRKLILVAGLLTMGLGQLCVAQPDDQTGTDQMLQQVKELQQQQIAAQNASNQLPLQQQPSEPQPVQQSQTVMQSTPVPNQPYLQGQLYSNVSSQQQEVAGGSSYNTGYPFKAPFGSQQFSQNPASNALQQNAFATAVQGILPMTPAQIHRLKQLYSASQYAAAAPPGVPARPTATSLFVDLSPGATPPAINLSEGDITALVFLDSTGAPWPIAAIDNGNPTSFNIVWNKKDNVLMIQASSAFGEGNLAVRLKNLGPPVMISLITNTAVENGGVVDYRVDMRVPGYGPLAKPLPVVGLPDATSPMLLDVLDGIPPTGGRSLELSGDAGQAWLLQDKIYLRTRLTLLSPGWLQTMSSADGTNAYQLQSTPLLLMSQNGRVIQVRIQGF